VIIKKASSAVHYAFFGVFAAVLLLACVYNLWWLGVPISLAVPAGVLFFALTGYLYFLCSKLRRKLANSEKAAKKATYAVSAAVFILIALCAVFFKNELWPIDLGIVDKSARILAADFNPQNLNFNYTFNTVENTPITWNLWEYFQSYPYNANLTLILTLCYKIGLSPAALNAALLFAGYIFTVKTAEKIYGNPADTFMTALISALFPVFYGYVILYYTDTFSMTFLIISVYFTVCALKSGRAYLFAVSAVFAAVGNFIKNNVVVLLIAFILYALYRAITEKRAFFIKAAAVFGVLFAVFTAGLQFAAANSGIYSKETLHEYEFPKTHWIMMGLRGDGDYSREDYEMTFGAGDYESKKEMNIRVIKERLSSFTFPGIMKHLFYYKAARTWGGSVYLIPYYNPGNAVLNSVPFAVISTLVMYVLVAGIALSFRLGAKNDNDPLLYPRIVLCGVFLLYLIWETRSRYLITFAPMFLLTFSHGLSGKYFGKNK